MFLLEHQGRQTMNQSIWNQEPKQIFPPWSCLHKVFVTVIRKGATTEVCRRHMHPMPQFTTVLPTTNWLWKSMLDLSNQCACRTSEPHTLDFFIVTAIVLAQEDRLYLFMEEVEATHHQQDLITSSHELIGGETRWPPRSPNVLM